MNGDNFLVRFSRGYDMRSDNSDNSENVKTFNEQNSKFRDFLFYDFTKKGKLFLLV